MGLQQNKPINYKIIFASKGQPVVLTSFKFSFICKFYISRLKFKRLNISKFLDSLGNVYLNVAIKQILYMHRASKHTSYSTFKTNANADNCELLLLICYLLQKKTTKFFVFFCRRDV